MSSHGHVTPNPDGSKARCGGPALCSVCAGELLTVAATATAAPTLPTIGAVEALRVLPDDVIVLTIDANVDPAAVDRIRERWLSLSGLPNRVVVTSGITVAVVRPDEVAADA